MAKDWPGSRYYAEAHIAAYYGTRQWVHAVRRWIADAPNLPFVRQDLLRKRLDSVLAGDRPLDSTLWRFINFYRWLQIRNVAL